MNTKPNNPKIIAANDFYTAALSHNGRDGRNGGFSLSTVERMFGLKPRQLANFRMNQSRGIVLRAGDKSSDGGNARSAS